jgi:hypothetical protein
VELDQAARDGVAIGRAFALLVDIGLHRQALAWLVLAAQVRANLQHRQRGLVAQPSRLFR